MPLAIGEAERRVARKCRPFRAFRDWCDVYRWLTPPATRRHPSGALEAVFVGSISECLGNHLSLALSIKERGPEESGSGEGVLRSDDKLRFARCRPYGAYDYRGFLSGG